MDTLLTFFAGVRLWDVADILLISYILFRVYALFRGTLLFGILMGISILWFVLLPITQSRGMVLTSQVFQGIAAAAALIIIVVFRNEIRSLLLAKNLKSFFWGFPRLRLETPVEVIVESAYELAKKRTGALIVLMGNEDLGEVIHSGISWHGQVSREMILSIFWRDNPVHDGAVIIQGDQIRDVAAILPLSQRKDLPSRYGTRHRAAAGLAEATDALVIVVSEERGTVSVAKGTEMKAVAGEYELLQVVREHLGIPENGEGGRRRGRLEFAIAGFVCLICVSFYWYIIARGEATVKIFDEVPVEYVNSEPGMGIIGSVNSVRVELSGSARLIRQMNGDQFNVSIDLDNVMEAEKTFKITRKNMSLPPGVRLQSVIPEEVEVVLDRMVRKVLPIQVDWVGKLPENLRLVEAKVTPAQIAFTDGSRVINEISTIYTEKVPLDQIQKSGTITADLDIYPASLKMDSGSKTTVDINFKVAERIL
jgi:diadenylate cyclase